MVDEVEMAADKLRNNRAVGPDNVQSEFIKLGGSILHNELLKVIQKVWAIEKNTRGMARRYHLSRTHKKRLSMRMSKLQRHQVANTVYKDFLYTLYKRLQSYAVNIICKYQCGCREGKSTTDQIHALRQILKKTREHKISTYNLFVDFEVVHDSTGTVVAQWLRYCATNRKVIGSIPDGVIGIFH
jgi:hypothetical protein